jgi:NADH-quinone oxidoreductase subunit D
MMNEAYNLEYKSLKKEGDSEIMILNMGPQHPSTHGVLRLELKVNGEIIEEVIPHIGYLHRCFEKHAEACNYQQVIPYVDRMDYLSSMYNDFGYAIAVEKLLGIEIPERVEYIRIIMGEFQRIASHLVAIGTFGLDVGSFTPFLYCFRDREKILTLFEKTCGARLLYNYIWPGGVSHDLYPEFKNDALNFLKEFKRNLKDLEILLVENKIFIERTAGIGVLPENIAINYAASGPMIRGSGIPYDIRKIEPYGIYDRFEFNIPVGEGMMGKKGDCWDRFYVRYLEILESIKIIEQALDSLPDGNVFEKLPKKIKPKKGIVYSRVESPRGELGFFIISDGSDKPFRIKVRAPSFVNLSILPEIAKGCFIADLVAILGSIDIVLGEVDR